MPARAGARLPHRVRERGDAIPPITLVDDTGDILGKLLLALDIALTGDHDALGLGRTGAVHGLGAVADSGCAQHRFSMKRMMR